MEQKKPELEPGQDLEITLQSGRLVKAKTLSLRKKAKVIDLLEEATKGTQAWRRLIEVVEVCCPDITEEELDAIDERAAGEIAAATLAAASLSGEERKKSE